MLTKTAIYKKYADLTDYEQFAQSTLDSLHGKFPQVQIRSFSEFKTFLDSLVPKLIHRYMLRSGSMKICSTISSDFAEVAATAGFPVITKNLPGHMVNVVLTTEGPYIIDLSYIQYLCGGYDLIDPDTREEVLETFHQLYKDPFKAIKIEQHPKTWISGTNIPHGEYDNLYDPVKWVNDYNMKENEETFPETFDAYKKENK